MTSPPIPEPLAGWTPERVARLRALVGTGVSFATIATELGGITRNAVMGKVHRLGLRVLAAPGNPKPVAMPPRPAAPGQGASRPTEPSHTAPSQAAPSQAASSSSATRTANPALAAAPPGRPTVRIVDLGGPGVCRKCRFILGAVAGPEATLYCGAMTAEPGGSYCREHAAVCFAGTTAVPRSPGAAVR